MYFEFLYRNTTQYDFFVFFETLGQIQYKKTFYFIFYL